MIAAATPQEGSLDRDLTTSDDRPGFSNCVVVPLFGGYGSTGSVNALSALSCAATPRSDP